MAVLLFVGSEWFDFGQRKCGVIAWGVAAGPKQISRVNVCHVSLRETDIAQSVRFELSVELLLCQSNRLAVYNALEGLDWFFRGVFVVYS